MPHCNIEYSQELEKNIGITTLMHAVRQAVQGTELFRKEDIKVRAIPYTHYQVGESSLAFIHITIRILEGRTKEQKTKISNNVLKSLENFPLSDVSLTVEICDIEQESYAKIIK